jgi:uncharacterized damage-inducible protein DinB
MASAVESILQEFRDEMPATRRLLERVPADKLAWKPHAKSRSLGELAAHVANIPGMAVVIVSRDDFSPGATPPPPANTIEEIRANFEKNVTAGEQALGTLTEESAERPWTFSFKGKTIFTRPKLGAVRVNLLNHLYHHRGQLGVYLRLLDAPVPMVYGPTADENPFA